MGFGETFGLLEFSAKVNLVAIVFLDSGRRNILKRLFIFIFLGVAASGCVTTGPTVTSIDLRSQKEVDIEIRPTVINEGSRNPTILIFSGSGGVEGKDYDWAEFFKANGYNTIIVEYIRSRGIQSLTLRLIDIPGWQVAMDAHKVAEWVMRQPWSNGNVGMIGFSWGGRAGIYAASGRQATNDFGKPTPLKAVVAVYPGCPVPGFEYTDDWSIPVQIHWAEKEMWTNGGLSACEDAARNNKMLQELYVYPDTHHNYDNPSWQGVVYLPCQIRRAYGLAGGCSVAYSPSATNLTRERSIEFFDRLLK